MLSLRAGEPLLVAGPPRSGRTTALATICAAARGTVSGVRVASLRPAGRGAEAVGECCEGDHATDSVADFVDWVTAQVSQGQPVLAVIDDAERVDEIDSRLAGLVACRDTALRLVIAGRADLLRSTYGHWSAPARRTRHGLALRPNLDTDGELWQTPLPRRLRLRGGPGRGVLLADGEIVVVQVAHP